MNSQFVKRLKSFLWRLSMALVVVAVDFAAAHLGMFDLPAPVVFVLGYALGEVSKYLNNNYPVWHKETYSS